MIGYTVSAVQISANRRAAFLLAQALSGRIIPSVSLKVNRRDVKEGQHGVRWLEWSGATDVEPNTDWLADEEKAKGRFEELVAHYENPGRSPALVKGWLIQKRVTVDERFIAQTPPPNYQ